jgi:DNA polymerase-3 subunit alpha
MDNIPMFGARKNGREPIAYPHALLERVLAETYGIFVYQEQVMQAAQVVAGFSLGEADLLRRAMGKKIQAEMDAQRERFVSGAGKNGCRARGEHAVRPHRQVRRLRLQQEPRRGYALIAYQTAWLKAHHPTSSTPLDVLRHQPDGQALPVRRRHAAQRRRVPAALRQRQSPPSSRSSRKRRAVAVRFALGALKGVGEGAMEQLCAERLDARALQEP